MNKQQIEAEIEAEITTIEEVRKEIVLKMNETLNTPRFEVWNSLWIHLIDETIKLRKELNAQNL